MASKKDQGNMAGKDTYITVREFYQGLDQMEDRINTSLGKLADKQDKMQENLSSIQGGNKVTTFLVSTGVTIFGILIDIFLVNRKP